ncbi:DUF938 domain-containing protein [Idiomarina xiamenensis]|uniref:S-adenosylmethionine-dependent methyltransferase n=1 Tax=Idiomarina xiamenensis 10-D-4 TaxID=740709 RepID=K2JHP7_9GAMM|nr:DUF938 domain-containing protein [Idiomarina xiamenensis]EKE82906.1 S-adenosylmethionine-dependent methyltransferase [Idiomarina xiamenensis 10-D-4]
MTLPFSQACENNKAAILTCLKNTFQQASKVLEVGSGSGQHAVYFRQQLPHLQWQCSDRQINLRGLQARLDAEAPQLPAAKAFDVMQQAPVTDVDALFSANTCHIMPTTAVEALFAHFSSDLGAVKRLCIYGPFNDDGNYSSASNADFDRYLRSRDVQMGIRDQQWIAALAQAQGFQLVANNAMPANNRLLDFKRD